LYDLVNEFVRNILRNYYERKTAAALATPRDSLHVGGRQIAFAICPEHNVLRLQNALLERRTRLDKNGTVGNHSNEVKETSDVGFLGVGGQDVRSIESDSGGDVKGRAGEYIERNGQFRSQRQEYHVETSDSQSVHICGRELGSVSGELFDDT